MIFDILCLAAAIIGYAWWKKYRDKGLLWFSIGGALSFVTGLLSYLLKDVFGVTSGIFLILNGIFWY